LSGHSKWSTIKHAKGINDARRGKLFTKLTKEVIIAAKQGGTDPEGNFKLRMAIQRAKDQNLPNDNIERAIKRASGDGPEGEQMVETAYEGYGPGGIAILVEVVTDNKNRTVSDVRSTFTKSGGNLANAGAVAWQFDQKGVVIAEADEEAAEELALAAIDAGALDFETDDGVVSIYSTPETLEGVRTALDEVGAAIRSSELSMVPQNTVALDAKESMRTLRLLDQLEELEDVQRVYSNADFPDEALEEYGAQS
jgi:YebC/PmpR family DNA-binding regulatory protein